MLVICSNNSCERVRTKRSPSSQQFVEDHAQAEDVRPAIDPVSFTTGLLGTHVGRRPSIPRARGRCSPP